MKETLLRLFRVMLKLIKGKFNENSGRKKIKMVYQKRNIFWQNDFYMSKKIQDPFLMGTDIMAREIITTPIGSFGGFEFRNLNANTRVAF